MSAPWKSVDSRAFSMPPLSWSHYTSPYWAFLTKRSSSIVFSMFFNSYCSLLTQKLERVNIAVFRHFLCFKSPQPGRISSFYSALVPPSRRGHQKLSFDTSFAPIDSIPKEEFRIMPILATVFYYIKLFMKHENILLYRGPSIGKIPSLGPFLQPKIAKFQIFQIHSSTLQYKSKFQTAQHFL